MLLFMILLLSLAVKALLLSLINMQKSQGVVNIMFLETRNHSEKLP